MRIRQKLYNKNVKKSRWCTVTAHYPIIACAAGNQFSRFVHHSKRSTDALTAKIRLPFFVLEPKEFFLYEHNMTKLLLRFVVVWGYAARSCEQLRGFYLTSTPCFLISAMRGVAVF